MRPLASNAPPLNPTPNTHPQTHPHRHTLQNGASEAIRKVKVLSYTGLASLAFSAAKWFFQGADYGCGFTAWPTFGFAAMRYTWNFDWQLNYVGAGMICPHVVNWSMLFGAVLSWGFMWPLLAKREGDWYPAGLDSHDFQARRPTPRSGALGPLFCEGVARRGASQAEQRVSPTISPPDPGLSP